MTIEAMEAWIVGLAEHQPIVMFAEDLHWRDASTIEFLGSFLEQSATAKALVVFTYRPEFEVPWSEGLSHVTRLGLERLSRADAAALARVVAGEDLLSEDLVEEIVDRADGNPLYLEELNKSVVEASGNVTEGDHPIPSTLRDSLMSRLDRLEHGKRLAQVGAVLGREFHHALLEVVAELDSAQLRRGV